MGLISSIDSGWINQNKTVEKSTTNMTQPEELSQLPPMRDYRVERKAPYKQSARNLSMNINIHIYYIKYLRWMWVRLWALSSTLDCEWDVTPPHSRHSWKLLRIPLECPLSRGLLFGYISELKICTVTHPWCPQGGSLERGSGWCLLRKRCTSAPEKIYNLWISALLCLPSLGHCFVRKLFLNIVWFIWVTKKSYWKRKLKTTKKKKPLLNIIKICYLKMYHSKKHTQNNSYTFKICKPTRDF